MRSEAQRAQRAHFLCRLQIDSRLVSLENGRIIDRTVMMDLAPMLAFKTEDAGSAGVKIECEAGAFVAAALASHGVKHIAKGVYRVVVKLDD